MDVSTDLSFVSSPFAAPPLVRVGARDPVGDSIGPDLINHGITRDSIGFPVSGVGNLATLDLASVAPSAWAATLVFMSE